MAETNSAVELKIACVGGSLGWAQCSGSVLVINRCMMRGEVMTHHASLPRIYERYTN